MLTPETAERASPSAASGHDPINHPAHYTSLGAVCACGRPIECIQVTERMGFLDGNAVKYLWRQCHKGDRLTDLRKAAWYIARAIAQAEASGAPR